MFPFLPVALAALLGSAAPAPEGAGGGAPVAEGPLVADATQGEAPPPESPGRTAGETGAAEAAAKPGRERTWFALPTIFWLPETKLGFAGAAGLHFHVGGARQASSAFLVVGYTIKGQGSVDLSSDLELRHDVLVSGRLRLVYFPDTFYGIGPETTLAQREEMTRRFVEVNVASDLPLVGRKLRAGPRLQARAEEITDVTPGGAIATGQVEGADGFTAIGLGAAITWDSRDRPLWPGGGSFWQAAYMVYPASLGRNDGYGRASLEGRYFLPLGRERILGLAALLEQSHGATPFSVLAKIGSTRYLRGIYEGRWRDQLAWAAQAELRIPVRGRFFATAFGAFGDVAPRLTAIDLTTTKFSAGAGVRYRLTDQGANIRLDGAIGPEGPAVYLLLLEAF